MRRATGCLQPYEVKMTKITDYTQDEQSACIGLVDFIADRIRLENWHSAMLSAVDSLAQEAHKMWPPFVGQQIKLDTDHLGVEFNEIATEDEKVTFLVPLGYILLNGQDGPLATAVAVRNTINKMATLRTGDK